MDRKDELELFSQLARNDRLVQWLKAKLDGEIKVLVSNPDVEQIRKAQGKAQLLQYMLDLLDKSRTGF